MTSVRLHVPYRPLNALTTIGRPRLVIDLEPPRPVHWGKNLVALTPGRHQLRCYVTVFGRGQWGESTHTVVVLDGGTVDLRWLAQWNAHHPGEWVEVRASGLS